MSYSFSMKAETKEAVQELVVQEMDNVVAVQSAHATEADLVKATSAGLLEKLNPASQEQCYIVKAAGSISTNETGVTEITSNVTAALVDK